MPIFEVEPLHAIVVDADSAFRRALEDALTGYGLETLAVDSVEDALSAAAWRMPDVVIFPQPLPAAARLVQALRARGPGTAIIALARKEEGPTWLVPPGCDAFVITPCAMADIVARVDQALDAKAGREPAKSGGAR